jgi:hypothetical protein
MRQLVPCPCLVQMLDDEGLNPRHLLGYSPRDTIHRRFYLLSSEFRTGTPSLIPAVASPKPDTVLHMSLQ